MFVHLHRVARARTRRLGLVVLLAGLALQLAIAGAAHAATSLSIAASASSVTYGSTATLSGLDAPVGVAEQLTIEAQASTGAWTPVGTATTVAATGAWSLTLPGQLATTVYRVQNADGSVVSPSVTVAVAPVIVLKPTRSAKAFFGETVRVRVLPATGPTSVRLTAVGAGSTSNTTVRIHDGVGVGIVADPGTGRFTLTATSTATTTLAAGTASASFAAAGRSLEQGDAGPDVAGIMQRLHGLGFEIPGNGSRYTFSASQTTLAFQKAYGLPRTYDWGSREWALLARLKTGPKPKFASDHSVHIEVDKKRQILTIAQGSKVLGIIAVSTGATGNTPVGTFHIDQMGGSYLYRFMAFHDDFGIHGYDPVPAYPASHGCVREPDWAATYTWDHSHLGTTVYVYQ